MTDRTRPSVAFWLTAALVAVLVGYPLSIGPVPMQHESRSNGRCRLRCASSTGDRH